MYEDIEKNLIISKDVKKRIFIIFLIKTFLTFLIFWTLFIF